MSDATVLGTALIGGGIFFGWFPAGVTYAMFQSIVDYRTPATDTIANGIFCITWAIPIVAGICCIIGGLV